MTAIRLLLIVVFLGSSGITTATQLPRIWFEDGNLGIPAGIPTDFKSRFHQPWLWSNSLKTIKIFQIRANSLLKKENGFDDAFIRNKMIPLLKANRIDISLDVQGATWLNSDPKRRKLLEREMALIQRVKRLGGKIRFVNVQSVLSKPLILSGQLVEYPIQKRIQDVLDYGSELKRRFPEIELGIIDALPTQGKKYQEIYTLLLRSLENRGMSLAFLHLDCPYEYPTNKINGMSWEKVAEVKAFVHDSLNIPFGLIVTSGRGGKISDQAFEEDILDYAKQIKRFDIHADQFILMSWFPHPTAALPEDPGPNRYSYLKTLLAFTQLLN